MSQALLERETIDSTEIALLVKGEELPPFVAGEPKKETRSPTAEKDLSNEVENTQDQVSLSEANVKQVEESTNLKTKVLKRKILKRKILKTKIYPLSCLLLFWMKIELTYK